MIVLHLRLIITSLLLLFSLCFYFVYNSHKPGPLYSHCLHALPYLIILNIHNRNTFYLMKTVVTRTSPLVWISFPKPHFMWTSTRLLAEWPLLALRGEVRTFFWRLTGYRRAGEVCAQSYWGSWKFQFYADHVQDQERTQDSFWSYVPLASHLSNTKGGWQTGTLLRLHSWAL